MENLIANHHPFKKHLWPGGDTSTPILIHKPPLEEPETRRQVSKNALRPRKPLNKPPPCRKQRRISNYFLRTGSTSNSNDQMMEMLSKVSSEVSKLRKEFRLMRQLNKRKKSRTHSKRSAFQSLIGSPHKPQLSHRGCQTDPTEHSTDDVPNETVPFFLFPIIFSRFCCNLLTFMYVCQRRCSPRHLWRKIIRNAPPLLSANMQLSSTANLPASQLRSTQHISLQNLNKPHPYTPPPFTPYPNTPPLNQTL